MAEEDLGSKTEEPTPRRREKAQEEGQVARSPDLNAAAVLLTGIIVMSQTGGDTFGTVRDMMQRELTYLATADLTPAHAAQVLVSAGSTILAAAAPVALAMALAGVATSIAQVGLGFYPKLLLPNPTRLSPGNGIKRIFSSKGAVDLLKSVLKIGLVSWVAWKLLLSTQMQLPAIGLQSPNEILAIGAADLMRMLGWVATTLAALAALDYGWQRFNHQRSLRMTRQEVKEELRQSEGDPKLRQRMKRAFRDLTSNRMLSDVAQADVVITNPTHVAVALRYRTNENGAPRVVAKGADEVCERIKQLARANGVPIIERRALARALFRSVKVGSEIPSTLYRAVAEVLAYIYGLSERKAG
ncbi:MAG: flagellar biosynthesis protein FlhB [Deltaproteobacteria bacterium]|nr:flagellar biosynthesis protein FlhB [Deltaproteobacteria bacterium]